LIDQLRHAVVSGGKMTEQRVPFSIREEARMGLQDWFADRIDTWFFNQLSGYTTQTDSKFTGNNAAITPSATTWVFAQTTGGGEASEASLTSTASQIFSLEIIDKAVLKAKTLTPVIRPVKTGNAMANYVMFITPKSLGHAKVTLH
jgi:N4-gp56 family major capsid protein